MSNQLEDLKKIAEEKPLHGGEVLQAFLQVVFELEESRKTHDKDVKALVEWKGRREQEIQRLQKRVEDLEWANI